MSLTGATSATVATDASGNFSFPAVPNGSFTVTPSGLGFAFSPTSQNITVNGANVGAVNFTATALTYSIAGTISGGAGATVNLSGPVNATTTADSSGNYSFAGITSGSYRIVPTKTNLIFAPASLTAVVAGANVIGANFTVPAYCPCSTIWQSTATPTVVDAGDQQAIEVGVKFRADSNGYITGIRFYKAAANAGTHLGRLWSSGGTLLATATFTNEGSSGWQQVFFNNPIAVVANTTYVASYFAPSGDYSADSGYFANSGVDTPPLHALANGIDGANGVFLYGPNGGFPTNSFNSANYWVDVIYVGAYSVTGTISGAGGAGATVTLGGAASASTTADASGSYSFSGVTNGNYTVTPTKTGFVFAPTSQGVTVAGSNIIVPVFTATAQTFTISGTISGVGGNGATVSLSGAATATTTANASGVYTFSGVTNGAYTVTPTKAGFLYTPTSQAVTVSGANATANFSSSVQTFTITGTISGSGGNGATVSLGGAATATTTANTSGVYSFSVPNGSFTVTPTKAGFVFTPASSAVTVNGANATANFGSTQVFTISGTISGPGGSGATVNLTGAATATVTANASGLYSFSVPNGSYTVTPTKAGFVFTPASSAVTVNGANATANFGSAQIFTITGTISGAGGSGATVKLTGATTATVIANASGGYSFSVVNGSYTVTPTKAGFAFTPANQAITVNGANKTANFSSAPTFTISGTISGIGASGATVKLTGAATATVTTNSSGVYTFTGVTAGSYTVTPSKPLVIFLPGSKSTTVTSGNVTGINFTAL
jgi:hypothetical protein